MGAEAREHADLILRARRVVLPGSTGPAAVHVTDGLITAVTDHEAMDGPPGALLLDVGEAVIMPGLVDTHVHVNDPGRAEWEGFESATRAAAAGGVTTLVDMPLNSVPATTTAAGLREKLEAAAGRCLVDVGFWGGVVPGNERELARLWEMGVLGFKCFLAPSGVAEFEHVEERDLRRAMPLLTELGAPLLVHAEMPGPLDRASRESAAEDPRRYAAYLASRPPAAELEAVELLIRLCREHGTRVHVVHLSTAAAVPALREARAEGLPITVETCPHYLHFAAEDVTEGATQLKCAPPIRGRDNRDGLWTALGSGDIDMIVSDHSPCPPELKARDSGDFRTAWGGIASLQLGLPVVWRGAREHGYTPARLAEWMSAAPARLAGLDSRKGAIEPGRDADLVVWLPDEEFLVDPDDLHDRHRTTPYVGAILPGVVETTYLRGVPVYSRGGFTGAPLGEMLLREKV